MWLCGVDQIAGVVCRGGIGANLASFLRFWAMAARRNSCRAPVGPRSRSRTEPKDALEVSEEHLDPLALVPRLLERRSASKGAGEIAGALIDAARNPANRCIG